MSPSRISVVRSPGASIIDLLHPRQRLSSSMIDFGLPGNVLVHRLEPAPSAMTEELVQVLRQLRNGWSAQALSEMLKKMSHSTLVGQPIRALAHHVLASRAREFGHQAWPT